VYGAECITLLAARLFCAGQVTIGWSFRLLVPSSPLTIKRLGNMPHHERQLVFDLRESYLPVIRKLLCPSDCARGGSSIDGYFPSDQPIHVSAWRGVP